MGQRGHVGFGMLPTGHQPRCTPIVVDYAPIVKVKTLRTQGSCFGWRQAQEYFICLYGVQ